MRWHAEGERWPTSPLVASVMKERRAEEDIVGRWLDDDCLIADAEEQATAKGRIGTDTRAARAGFVQWAEGEGHVRAWSAKALTQSLAKKGIEITVSGTGASRRKVYTGLTLRADVGKRP